MPEKQSSPIVGFGINEKRRARLLWWNPKQPWVDCEDESQRDRRREKDGLSGGDV